jgi:hypothetical protein
MKPSTFGTGGLTGKRRFKVECLFRNHDYQDDGLVLQVEYTEFVNVAEGKPGRWVCMWRDATPEDVTEEVV